MEDPGTFSILQDAGRRGVAHLGVPGAGPADPLAHGLANRLVGNHPGAAALEVTARGPVLRCLAPAHVAVVGGGAPVTLDGRPVGTGHVLPLAAGQRLAIGTLRHGLRCYLAAAGGLHAAEVLGSASTDVLAGLGPGPLAAGDELATAGPPGPMADHLRPAALPDALADPVGTLADPGLSGVPAGPDLPGAPTGPGRPPRVLRVLPGPHPEWFPEGALAQLAGTTWAVGEASDRVGLRLRPARVVAGAGDGTGNGTPLDRYPGELDSQGMVTGAVQVPPGGEPVVLGPDHATLGGYPVVAVVISADRPVLGQCRPGDELRMLPVTPADAAAALAALERAAAAAVAGRYPTVPG